MAVSLKDTLQTLHSIEGDIKASAERMRRQPLTVQELVAAVESSLQRTDALLKDEPDLSEDAKNSLEELIARLRDIEHHLRDHKIYGFRARFLRRLEGIFVRQRDVCAPYRLRLRSAVEALKASLPSGDTLRVLPTIAGDIPTVEPSKKTRKLDTVVDAIEIGLHAVSKIAEAIPAPASGIVKALAGTGICIIDLLNGVSDNREEALALGRHIGVLVQTVVGFLEAPASGQQEAVDERTEQQLSAFLVTLKSVESSIEQLRAQSDIKQGISHKSNKTDLKNCETEVKRAFDQLQNRLSLHALRTLTKMSDADARLERIRLLDRLGDGATGATSKAEEDADLMCHPQTRRAVLDDINRWVTSPLGERILWVSGVAGCGKSAITATIPHEHQKSASSAIFYLNRGTQERNQRVVCSLSRQLARVGHGVLERVILEAVDAEPDISTSHLATQFQSLLINPLKKLVPGSPPVLILIDGLDEWENHDAASKLVELIGRAHSELLSTVRFVIASRNESYIVSSMRKAAILPLVKRYELDKVPRDDALNDVRAYLGRRFAVIRSNSTDPTTSKKHWPKKNDMEVLVDLSGGLFQWAATVMKYIEQRQSNTRLRRVLDAPEEFRGLDGLYSGILQSSIEADTAPSVLQLLQKVLGFIVVAPIPVDAITITALCADPSKGEMLEDIQEDILARLASFLILPKDPSEPIRISHKSAVDFTTNAERCTDPRFFIRAVDHHERLASISLTLLKRDLTHNICKISNRKTSNKRAQDEQLDIHISSTLRYVCRHWARHLSLAGHERFAELSNLLDEFASGVFMYWVEVMSLCGFVNERQAALVVEEALSWFSTCLSPTLPTPLTQLLLTDMVHFLDMFERPIAETAGLIYACALPLAMSGTELQNKYSDLAAEGLRAIRGPSYSPKAESFWIGKDFPELISMAADGSVFASPAKNNHAIILWDGTTGEQRGEPLRGHTEAVSCMAFTFNGMCLASASSDGTVRMWDTRTGSQKGRALEVGEQHYVECMALSSDDQTIALGFTSGDFQVLVLKDMGETMLWLNRGGSRLPSVQDHSAQQELESELTRAVELTERLTKELTAETAPWVAAEAAQWARAEAAPWATAEAAPWATAEEQKLVLKQELDRTQEIGRALDRMRMRPPKSLLGSPLELPRMTLRNHKLALRDWERQLELLVPLVQADLEARLAQAHDPEGGLMHGQERSPALIIYSSEGKLLGYLENGASMRLWDMDVEGEIGRVPLGNQVSFTTFAFSPSSTELALGDEKGTMRLWDVETKKSRAITSRNHAHRGPIQKLQFSADSRRVASLALGEGCIRFWELEKETGGHRGEPFKGYAGRTSTIVFSYGSKMFAPGTMERVWVLDTEVKRGVSFLKGHTSLVVCLAFSNDGQTLASGAIDGVVCLWDTNLGSQTGHITSVQGGLPMALNFTEDDSKLVASHGMRDTRLEVETGDALRSGEIDRDGWVLHSTSRWFWLPVCGGEWLLHGTCLAARTGFCVFIFDVSGIMDMIS